MPPNASPDALPPAAWSAIRATLGAGAVSVEPVAGGLFNRVFRLTGGAQDAFLKVFTESASSGSFPPLPTTARQRCRVAVTCHREASATSLADPTGAARVPDLLAGNLEHGYVLMASAPGRDLHREIVASPLDERLLAVGDRVCSWLAQLHRRSDFDRAGMAADSHPHKVFKVDLQYGKLLRRLPYTVGRRAEAFIASVVGSDECLLHGDINSRNVLVDEAGDVAVIDFEQAQLGQAGYDVSYLVSEYAIAALAAGQDPTAAIRRLWDSYNRASPVRSLDYDQHRAFRAHLAFQVLYRLVGPSRQVWSGHLADGRKREVEAWALAQMGVWL